jgi:hypothetical protein
VKITAWYLIGDDRAIRGVGGLESLHSLAQRERYCIWGLNREQGNLVCAYNGKSPGGPVYPSSEATRQIRAA